jgi:dihydrolipoyl dehydrogenase
MTRRSTAIQTLGSNPGGGRNLYRGFSAPTDERVSRLYYCQPQVASIGLTEKAAKEQGLAFKVGKFPFTASGKALAAGEPEGFVKLLIAQPHGEIFRAHIIGAEATELIAELGLAMNVGATYEEIGATMHAHPTLSESVHEAAGAAFGHAIHIGRTI